MNINEYPEIDVSDNMLDQIATANKNLLLIGNHGCGKTERVVSCFERNKLNYAYFSAPTCDPWIDFIGIPKEDEETGHLKFVRPARINENLEAIFLDEYNRAADKATLNAMMELLQFKSINGRKFPNLKIVWASINPPSDEMFNYNVEEIDPAQIDRFQCIIRIPSRPSERFFNEKYKNDGNILVKWWAEQHENSRKHISSRRLEEAYRSYKQGIPLNIILPSDSNIKQLVTYLQSDPVKLIYDDLLLNPCEENYKKLIDTGKLNYIKKTFTEESLKKYTPLAPRDIVSKMFLENDEYQSYVEFKYALDDKNFCKIYKEICSTYNTSPSVVRSLERTNKMCENDVVSIKLHHLKNQSSLEVQKNTIFDINSLENSLFIQNGPTEEKFDPTNLFTTSSVTSEDRMNLSASIYRFKSVNRRLCDLINVGSSYKDITSETLKIEIKCPIAKLSNATKIILKSYGKCTKNTIKKNFNDLLLVFSLMDDSLTKNGEFDTVLNRLLTVWSQDDYLSKKYSLQTLYTILPKSNDVFFAYVK